MKRTDSTRFMFLTAEMLKWPEMVRVGAAVSYSSGTYMKFGVNPPQHVKVVWPAPHS